jgi:CheY-like chemotaxis protein
MLKCGPSVVSDLLLSALPIGRAAVAPRITVVNDNAEFLALVRDILEDERYVTTTIDGDRDDALAAILASQPDLLVIDLRMGSDELHGWDIAQDVRREPALAGLPVLVCSADLVAMRAIAEDLAEAKLVGTLAKPFSIDDLAASIDALLAQTTAG